MSINHSLSLFILLQFKIFNSTFRLFLSQSFLLFFFFIRFFLLSFARSFPSLVRADLGKQLRIPSLTNVGVTFDSVHQRGFAQVIPLPGPEGELDIILTHGRRPLDELTHAQRHIHLLELGIIANTLKERDREACALSALRGEHAVRGAAAHAARQGLQTLAKGDDERAVDGQSVDPCALKILRLQTGLAGDLQQVGGQHRVLVRADALAREHVVLPGADVDLGVLDDLELVLLVGVEEARKGVGRHAQGLGHERHEEGAQPRHARHVRLEHGAEARQVRGRGPLVRREQVVVRRLVRPGERVRCREVELFAMVGASGRGFVVHLAFSDGFRQFLIIMFSLLPLRLFLIIWDGSIWEYMGGGVCTRNEM